MIKKLVPLAIVISFLLAALPAHADGPIKLGNGIPTSIAASPDGSEIAVGSSIGIWLLEPQSLHPQRFFPTQEPVMAVHYSQDGRLLLANHHVLDRAAGVWTNQDASTVSWIDPNCAHQGRYCFGDHKVASIVYSRWIVDTATGVDVQRLGRYVKQAAWSSDGSEFYAILYGDDIAAWAFQPGPGVAPWLAHLGDFFTPGMDTVTWSSDGTALSAGQFDWDAASGRPIGPYSCRFIAPDVNRFGCNSQFGEDRWDNQFYLYDTFGSYRGFWPHGIRTIAYAASNNGLWLATSGVDELGEHGKFDSMGFYRRPIRAASTRLWDWATLSKSAEFPALFFHLAISPHGETIVGISDTEVEAWDVGTARLLWTAPGQVMLACPAENFVDRPRCSNPAGAVAFSPDGVLVALSSSPAGNDVQLLSAATGQLMATLTGHTQPVSDLAFSPDGRRIAAGSSDGTVLVWNVPISQ